MTEEPLPLDLPAPSTCWYCGTASGRFETEHQRPVSRGGQRGPTVLACARCNSLKGPLDVEEFREGLAERLGLLPTDVVFAGEATLERPATARLATIRSLGAEQSVVRLDPAVGEELERAWRYLRTAGRPRLTRRDLASDAVSRYLDDCREQLLDGEAWPEPNLTLFDVAERTALRGRTDLSQTARVQTPRQHTKVSGDLLDWARAGVEFRRGAGEPDLTLLDWIDGAIREALAHDAERRPGYPTMNQALDRRYGSARPNDNGR